jgi:hypothetical protein
VVPGSYPSSTGTGDNDVKILFFAPHSAIWVHAFPEALIAEALQQGGHEIMYVTCGGTLNRYCIPMISHGLSADASKNERHKVCAQCNQYDSMLRKEFAFQGPRLVDLVDDEEERVVDQILASMTREAIMTLEKDGIALGRIALYQLMLRRKRIDLDFTETEWQEYLVELRNTLYAWQAGLKLLDKECPDRVIVYNGLYSVNRIVCKLAEHRGIPTYFMHAGGNLSNRLQTLMLGRGDTFQFMPHVVSQWPRFAEVPCSRELLSVVTDHYLELLKGRSVFVYSRAKSAQRFDARAHFGVAPHQKLLVATMGSYDEEVAAEMVGARQHQSAPLFATQVEWIKALLSFMKKRADLFLVVRIHPREFPNRRDQAISQHARLLQQVLQDFPSNVAVNWPADGISVYDLADATDVFLNSWSSVGKEMSLLGIPVVIYSDKLAFYPADLNYLGITLDSYFGAIEKALADGWNSERVRYSYRWAALEFVRACILIGDSYPEVEQRVRTLPVKIMGRLRHCIDPYFKQRTDCHGRRPQLSFSTQINRLIESGAESILEQCDPVAVEQNALDDETAALRFEMGRLVRALYPSAAVRAGSQLYVRLSEFARLN